MIQAPAGAAAGFLLTMTFTTSGSNIEFFPGSEFTLIASDPMAPSRLYPVHLSATVHKPLCRGIRPHLGSSCADLHAHGFSEQLDYTVTDPCANT
jgi:hypothetical protein